MKLLYIAVHSHTGWGAEYWLAQAFEAKATPVVRYDYRRRRRGFHWRPWWFVNRELRRIETVSCPDVVLLQRAEHVPVSALDGIQTPAVFWSTEPLQLKTDVDALLASRRFARVFVHSYSCLERVRAEFPHLLDRCSVVHNGCPASMIDDTAAPRTRFALFNRTLSGRRSAWLAPSAGLVECVQGRYGDDYFRDLSSASVAVNIHYSDRNLDDLESGVLEAMARGCVVVSERLNRRTLDDCGMADALLQVDSPEQLRQALVRLRESPALVEEYRRRSLAAARRNTWDRRAGQFLECFRGIPDKA